MQSIGTMASLATVMSSDSASADAAAQGGVVGDDELSAMEQSEFWLFMLLLVMLGSVFAVNIVRLCYNARNFHVADRVIDE